MKIVAIRGKNLASLEGEFMIDFTVEPLCSAGIFAITGSTGAGKSTLLDALRMRGVSRIRYGSYLEDRSGGFPGIYPGR